MQPPKVVKQRAERLSAVRWPLKPPAISQGETEAQRTTSRGDSCMGQLSEAVEKKDERCTLHLMCVLVK
jgi:hypothetical protein